MGTCDYTETGDRRKSCHHADQAAKQAVKETFVILGVNVDDPGDVERFRQDLRFGGMLRKAADRGWLVFWGTVAAAIAYTLYEGLKLSIIKGPNP